MAKKEVEDVILGTGDDGRVYIQRGKAIYVKIGEFEYPYGCEPEADVNDDPHAYFVANRKEQIWSWALRFGCLGIIVIVALIIIFILIGQ